MLTDYQIESVKEDVTTNASVSFYEGEIITEYEWTGEFDENGPIYEDVTRYRRLNKLRTEGFYFDDLTEEDNLECRLNIELAKDPDRTPIDEQQC